MSRFATWSFWYRVVYIAAFVFFGTMALQIAFDIHKLVVVLLIELSMVIVGAAISSIVFPLPPVKTNNKTIEEVSK